MWFDWLTKENDNTSETKRELVHYTPFPSLTANVQCLNGSAHVRTSSDLEDVTCPLCKDVTGTNVDFWSKKRTEFYARERQKTEQKIRAGLF